jgi:N-acyl-L-homoserine lactone synthetase
MMNTVNAAGIFAQNVIDLISRIEYRRAETVSEREAIYRLRYQCYLREGAILPNETGLFSDSYDEAPNVSIFGIYLDGKLVSSIRVHVATADQPIAPALTVFQDLLGPRLAAGEVIVDPTRFVVDHDESRQNPGLAYATVRLGMLASEHADADFALATVRTEHRAFYRRLLCMQPIGEPRAYPSLKDPINLMGVSFPEMRQRVYDRYPFMMSTAAEQEQLFGPKRQTGAKAREAGKGQAAAA